MSDIRLKSLETRMKCPCAIKWDMVIYEGISLRLISSRTPILDLAIDVPRDFYILWFLWIPETQDKGYFFISGDSYPVYPGKYLQSATAGSPYVLIAIWLSRRAPENHNSLILQLCYRPCQRVIRPCTDYISGYTKRWAPPGDPSLF